MSLRAGDAAAALAREIELWEAFRARDRAALERLIDPLALDVGPGGARTRSRLLVDVEHVSLGAFEIEGLSVVESGSTAVVVYQATVEGSYRGVPFRSSRIAVSCVWICDEDQWRLAHRCETPLAPTVT